MKILELPLWLKILVPVLLVGLVVLLIQRAIVGYGNDRAKAAVRPWEDAQIQWKATRAADDATNRQLNADQRAKYEVELLRLGAERNDVLSLLNDTRDRASRIEEAYRRYRLDAASRVAASEKQVADLLTRVEAARARVAEDLATYDTSCRRDAVRFTNLQDEVRPWVVLE